MRFDWKFELPQIVLLLSLFVAAAWNWTQLPEPLPVHFGLGGQPDRWGGKFEALLLMPLVSTALYVLLLFLPRIDPWRKNYDEFIGSYALIRFASLCMLAVVYGAMLVSYREQRIDLVGTLPYILGGLFLVIGGVMRRIQSNWFVGVRTPWTLSSAHSWQRTHRLAGPVFIAVGLLFMLAGVVGGEVALIAASLGLAAAILGLVVFSYVAWRSDPDRSREAAPGR